MYAHVSAEVKPAKSLLVLLYVMHILLLLIYISQYQNWPYLLPLMSVQGFSFYQLYKRNYYFLQHRHWSVINGRFYLKKASSAFEKDSEQGSTKESTQASLESSQAMVIQPFAIWPFVLMFRYRPATSANLNSALPWQWEMICKDALISSSFHPLAAVLNTTQPTHTN